ncbi:hypothetical protein ABZO31_33345 [Streptomyces sp. HUAS MG47]|uniref:hypothetical protein n=1 Tax=Streptomyces solicamelliae TaxID=3231716 RepID=UPI0038783893
MTDPKPPTRADVAARWHALVRGETTREAVHAWTVHWVEGEGAFADFAPLVETGLQYLHGFDLCRDPARPSVLWHGEAGEGEWYHADDAVAAGLAHWQRMCERHDADPEGWARAIES